MKLSNLGLVSSLPAQLVGVTLSFFTLHADVPTAPPVFSAPLNINNVFFPFEIGGVKIYEGSDHGTKIGAIDYYLAETRTFRVNHKNVLCHILVEEAYEDEELVERSFNYFAQADDGTVYYFGEVVDNYENGVIDNHHGSWLVGGVSLPSDPSADEVGNASAPAVFMPASPELGDVFKPEDLYPIVDETGTVVGVDLDVQVSGVKYDGAIKVEETTLLGPDREFKWYAPGVGVVKVQTKGESLRLTYSALAQPPDD